jgi:Phage integrase family
MIEVRRVCPLGFSGHTLDVLFSFLSSFRVRGFTVSASITNDILHAARHCSAHVQPWTTIFTVLQDKLRLRLESIRGQRLKEGERDEGQQLDMHNVKNRYFHKCLEKAGLRRIRFHDLRHTFASLLIQNGESLAYVKDQMGHSSIKMTVDVYGHLVPGANRVAVNRLPSIGSMQAIAAAT